MKPWMLTLLAAALTAMPALADKETDKSAADADTNGVETEKPDPIKRLVELRLDEYLVPARMINVPLPGKTRTVQEVLERLDEWTKDDKVGAVLLDLGPISLSLPDVQELQAAVEKIKAKGKKVHAFVNGGSANAYLLATVADEIVIAPSSSVGIPGLGRLFPYMKGYYQMMGVEYDVITAGKYKYPGFLNRREPDKYFEEEFGAILDSWMEDYVSMIAKGRNLPEDKVKEIIDHALFNAEDALQYGLVDKLAYYDDYRDRIVTRTKMKRYAGFDRDLSNVNSIQDLVQLINEQMQEAAESRKSIGPKIAVLHARGPIIDFNLGAGLASQIICRDDFSKVVDELRKNDSIKAVVMHVDSPGGSGYASDVIWQHLRRLDEAKPLVVCMGAVAGSGGYYIACPARRIFAQPTTITGSIGVLGILANSRSMFNRMDWEMAEMKRGARSLLGAPNRELSPEDRKFIQTYMDDFYDIFIDRVATTRKMPDKEVRKIAEGRIWTGRDALEIGLVDELGGLDDAIEAARAMANIPPSAELKIVHYPRASSLGELFGSLSPLGAMQTMEAYNKCMTAATPLGIQQQLQLLTQRIEPLCWMATPDFYAPPTITSPMQVIQSVLSPQNQFGAQPILTPMP